MKDFETMKDAVQFRITESEEHYFYEDYVKKAVKIFTADITATIEYIRNECTDEEFYWLSEIFEEIARKSQSMEFIDTLSDRLSRVVRDEYNQQAFISKHMRTYVDYDEYIRDLTQEIAYADGQILDYE